MSVRSINLNEKEFELEYSSLDGVRDELTEEPYNYMMSLTDLDVSWKAPK